ncbi:hypothetical protein BH23GEM2_BH23GEM2_06100 [soil metagenome]
MPVTARLSRQFYERLGDQIANELVDWLNAVDDSVHNQLIELNERNWERLRAELDARDARLDARDARLDARFAGFEVRFTQFETRLMKWMFGFWVTTLLAIAGLKLI